MVKVKIFVHCKGWIDGGYTNTLYFDTKKQAQDWMTRQKDIDVLSTEVVPVNEFEEDYIC